MSKMNEKKKKRRRNFVFLLQTSDFTILKLQKMQPSLFRGGVGG